MKAKKDRKGKLIANGSRVKWMGEKITFTTQGYMDGYKDVPSGARGTIVSIHHGSSKNMVLIKFDGHEKPVGLGLRGVERI